MENNKFNKQFSSESVSDLIVQLRAYKTAGYSIELKWAKAIIAHLAERELTNNQRKQVDDILSSDQTILTDESVERIKQKRKDSVNQPIPKATKKHPDENQKYAALRSIADIFFFLAVVVGFASVVGAIYFFTKAETGIIIAVSMIIGGAVTVLMLVVISELISLFIDIERNTRKAAERS